MSSSRTTPRHDQIALRLQRLIGLSWLVDGALLAALAALTGIGYYMPLLYVSIGLASVAIAYLLIRSGTVTRFADPSLSFPLLLVAVANQCLCLWLAPEVGIFFLMNIFQVFGYGLIRLDPRRFRMLVVTAALLTVVPIMESGEFIAFPLDTWTGRFLLFVTLVLCLGRLVGVGAFVGQLRARIAGKKAELAESEARFRSLTELSSDWYWEQDAEQRFIRVATGNRERGLREEELLGRAPWETGFSVELDGGWDAYRALVAEGREWRDLVMKRTARAGQEYYVSVSARPILDRAGRCTGYRGVAKEITEKRLADERIHYLATHDALTGLPNRMMFNELITHAIQASRRYGRSFALLFIDLDGFKRINDSLGHEAGDALLKELALRFRHSVRGSDVVARLGGDEFVVIASELENPAQAGTVAQKLLEAACAPVVLRGLSCHVSASIGLALYPQDGTDEQALLTRADGAMYLAKEGGKNAFRFHSAPPAAYPEHSAT